MGFSIRSLPQSGEDIDEPGAAPSRMPPTRTQSDFEALLKGFHQVRLLLLGHGAARMKPIGVGDVTMTGLAILEIEYPLLKSPGLGADLQRGNAFEGLFQSCLEIGFPAKVIDA